MDQICRLYRQGFTIARLYRQGFTIAQNVNVGLQVYLTAEFFA